MSESSRTLAYVASAVVALGVAGATHYVTKPKPVAGFERVGTDFFKDFEDPTLATSLKVTAFNEDTAVVNSFEVVEAEKGKWVIPSHHDYPADGEDRLAKTAASIIGIKRGALASRYEDDHMEYGVIDPDDEDGSKLTGRGQRITLKDKNDDLLADYIIGKEVEKPAGHYYVRVPNEKEVYISKFSVDLSTKFSDWIEDDLLKLDQSDLVEVRVDKYRIDEQQQAIVSDESNTLKKDGADWKLEGLKEDVEELQAAEISTMASTLDNLKIIGIRPKPEGINADLTVSPQVAQNRLVFDALQNDLAARGFRVGPKPDKDGYRLYANEGELTAGTKDGITYTLRFGEIFTGSQDEIEAGFANDTKPAKEDEDGKEEGEDKDKEEEPVNTKRSRYLFVSTAFDESYLDELPVKPTAPEQAKDEKPETKKDGEAKDGEAKDGEKKDDEQKEGEEKADDKEKNDDQSAAAQEAYEAALRKYESDVKARETKIEESKKQAEELNDRFGKWYYVISADSFEKLRLSRDSMVKAKEKEEDEKDDSKTNGAAKDGAANTDAGAGKLDPDAASTETPEMKDDPAGADDQTGKKGDDKSSKNADTAKPTEEPAAKSSEKFIDKPAPTEQPDQAPPGNKEPTPEPAKDPKPQEKPEPTETPKNESPAEPKSKPKTTDPKKGDSE